MHIRTWITVFALSVAFVAVIQMLPDGKKPTVQTQFTVQVYPKVEWMHRGRFDAEVAALAKVAR